MVLVLLTNSGMVSDQAGEPCRHGIFFGFATDGRWPVRHTGYLALVTVHVSTLASQSVPTNCLMPATKIDRRRVCNKACCSLFAVVRESRRSKPSQRPITQNTTPKRAAPSTAGRAPSSGFCRSSLFVPVMLFFVSLNFFLPVWSFISFCLSFRVFLLATGCQT